MMNTGAPKTQADVLMVDCGATAHIITNEKCFVKFDKTFRPSEHFIELADGRRKNNKALMCGDAVVTLKDTNGRLVEATLQNALYIPTYPHDIFSVRAATENGASVTFKPGASQMIAKDGTKFEIVQRGRLYYFENDVSCVNYDDVMHVNKMCDLKTWHRILGHCNVSDVAKLENVVQGMKISSKQKFDCETCILGKQTLTKNCEVLGNRATKILALVHTDLAGPISPVAKDGFHYAITFTDDFLVLFLSQLFFETEM